MKKYKSMGSDIQKIIDLMAENDSNAILAGIKSDIPILNLNSIIYGTKYNFNNVDFINIIKENFADSHIVFFGTELKCFALASLHMLRVQEYTGSDRTILNLINSKFDF